MAKSLRNTTISAISINDTGITIPASTTYAIPAQDWPLWAASVDVDSYINAGTLVVVDDFGDFKPQNGLYHIHGESVPRGISTLVTASIQATDNSTNNVTPASPLLWVYTGTVAGQIFKAGDARNYNVGHHYEIWNRSAQMISIQNNSGTTIGVMSANVVAAQMVLQDNTTAAGIWLLSLVNITTGVGTSATLTFTRNGGTSQGAYLYTGQTLTSFAGYIINGNNYITKISISNSSQAAAGKSATFRLQRRTALNTFVDISGTDITIPALGYNATVTGLLVPIGPDWEISAYRIGSDGGAGINNPVMNVYTVPQ